MNNVYKLQNVTIVKDIARGMTQKIVQIPVKVRELILHVPVQDHVPNLYHQEDRVYHHKNNGDVLLQQAPKQVIQHGIVTVVADHVIRKFQNDEDRVRKRVPKEELTENEEIIQEVRVF